MVMTIGAALFPISHEVFSRDMGAAEELLTDLFASAAGASFVMRLLADEDRSELHDASSMAHNASILFMAVLRSNRLA